MNNSELISAFLSKSQTDKNLSQRTIKAYSSDLYLFNKYIRNRKLIKVATNQIRQYLKYLQEMGLKATTIKRKLATLKVFFSFLLDDEIIEISPTIKIKGQFRIPLKLPRNLSYFEVKKLLSIASNEVSNTSYSSEKKRYQALRNRIIIEILYSTGIRVDELTKLKINNIDLKNQTMIITGKGNKERLIYISSTEVISLLKSYISYLDQIKPTSHAFLLNNQFKQLSVHSIGIIFRKMLKKCNFKKHYTPHCLRHTMATMLIENGADIRSVQEILGHASITTTEIYITVSKRRRKEVMKNFNGRNRMNISS